MILQAFKHLTEPARCYLQTPFRGDAKRRTRNPEVAGLCTYQTLALARTQRLTAGCAIRGQELEIRMGTDPTDIHDPKTGDVPPFENRNDVPLIHFDLAPAYGVIGGVVQVELGLRILIPHHDDSVDVRFVSCGRLFNHYGAKESSWQKKE
jgi:hypothetical protein